MAGALAPQHRQYGALNGERSEHVGLVHRADRGVVGFLDGGEQSGAGVVDQDVDPAEPLDRCVYGRLDALRVGHVQRRGEQRVAGVGKLLADGFGLPRGGDHLVAAWRGRHG